MAIGKKSKPARKKKLKRIPLPKPVTQNDIIDLARRYGPACIDTLADVAANGPPAARVSAANLLLDRGFGKVVHTIDHSSSDGSMSPSRTPMEMMRMLLEQQESDEQEGFDR